MRPPVDCLTHCTHVRSVLLRWAQEQIPQIAPLLGQVGHFHQHEGKAGHLTRVDKSTEMMDYPPASFAVEIKREEMKSLGLPALFQKFHAEPSSSPRRKRR